MTILFYSVSARKNELSKTLGTATTLTGTLREPVSLTDPEILIESATVPAYNYAYISDLGRYYFIRSVVAEQNQLYRLALHVDVLMSYKGVKNGSSSTGIYNLNPYVTRWENSPMDGWIPETEYPIDGVTELTVSSTVSGSAPGWEGSSKIYKDTGTKLKKYFLMVKGSGPSSVKALPLDAYYFDIDAFAWLTKDLSTNTSINVSGKAVTDYIYKFGVLPFQPPNLVSMANAAYTIGLPGSLAAINLAAADGSTPLTWAYPLKASYIPTTLTWTMQVSTPSTVHKCRNIRPFHKMSLRFRPFGKFELDEGLIFRNVDTSTTTFKVAVEVDPISGNASLYYGKSSADIYLGSANVMIQLPLSSESYSSAKIASGVLSVVGAVAATVATEGAAAPTIASAAVNAISSAVPNISVTGGEQVIIDDGPTVESYRKACEDYPDDLYGRPYYVRNRIYNLTGFIKTGTVNIEGTGFASMLDNERAELDSIMKAGIYV